MTARSRFASRARRAEHSPHPRWQHRLAGALLCAFAAAPAPAGEPATGTIKDEIGRQQSIYQSRGADTPDGYTTDRSLRDYGALLAPGFAAELATLRGTDRWLDIGAGSGRAILDLHAAPAEGGAPDKPRAVAVSIEDRRTPRWYEVATRPPTDRIQYVFGQRFGEIAPGTLGRFRLITDVFGGFSYTDSLTRFMTRALDALEVGGTLYTLLQDVDTEAGGHTPHHEGSPYNTTLFDARGQTVKPCAWLKRIACAEVACETVLTAGPPVETYRIRKTCDAVRVPELTLTGFEAGTPPQRRFHAPATAPGVAGGAPR